jgi:acid phosphatase family membrane protein YuiD
MIIYFASLYPIIAAVVANFIAQILKPFTRWYRKGEFDIKRVFSSGGQPSSHTAAVSALTFAAGLTEGFDSTVFAVTLVLALITTYDAINVRYYAGKNIEVTKALIEELKSAKMGDKLFSNPIFVTKMKSVLGHKVSEAFYGFILGTAVAFTLYFLFV